MKLHVITSNTLRLDGGSMYGRIPKTMWQKWTPADELNRITLACRTLFLQTEEGRNILFDVGVGDFFEPKLKERYDIGENNGLLNSLAEIGVTEGDIDTIILSHLHFDHAGGILSTYGQGETRLLFPNAKYYVGKEHWKQAQNPHPLEQGSFIQILFSLLENSGRLVLQGKTTHPDLNFGLTFDFSNGHTVGMIVSYLDLPSGLIVYASDLIPGLPWVHLPVTMGYDRYPELIVDEKKKLLERVTQQKGRIVFTHDLHTSCAQISKDPKGKFFGTPSNLF